MTKILIIIAVISLSLCKLTVPLSQKKVPLSHMTERTKLYNPHNLLNWSVSSAVIIENLTNYDLIDYYGTVVLGGNPYTFTFDTECDLMWITSDSCPNCRSI